MSSWWRKSIWTVFCFFCVEKKNTHFLHFVKRMCWAPVLPPKPRDILSLPCWWLLNSKAERYWSICKLLPNCGRFKRVSRSSSSSHPSCSRHRLSSEVSPLTGINSFILSHNVWNVFSFKPILALYCHKLKLQIESMLTVSVEPLTLRLMVTLRF